MSESADELYFPSADEILAADDLGSEIVRVPEWGHNWAVRVRGLTGAQRDRFEASCLKGDGKHRHFSYNNLRAKLVALSIVDASGRRLFSDAQIEALGEKSAAALQRVFNASQCLSAVSDDDMEELEKNSRNALNGASISDSQDTSAAPSPSS